MVKDKEATSDMYMVNTKNMNHIISTKIPWLLIEVKPNIHWKRIVIT
mgnify:CR=1 FL=1